MNTIKQNMEMKRQKRVLNQKMPMCLIVLVRDDEREGEGEWGWGGPYRTTY